MVDYFLDFIAVNCFTSICLVVR